MGSLQAELFVEDRAHEEFCKALVYRLCQEDNDTVHFPFVLCGHFLDGFLLERDMLFSEVVFV
jgi:hypothetical protein